MSGHSKWSTIKRKKGVADAKRGAVFTRLAREIVIAAREGGNDPNTNFRLRLAVDKARSENMPKDNIERAIKKGTGEDKEGGGLEELTFEGYGPHGSAIMVVCLSDNRNRTVPDIRHAFSKGGSMAESGAVAWQFERKSYFSFPSSQLSFDKAFELGIEAGADNVVDSGDSIEIYGAVESFKTIADALHKIKIQPAEAGLSFIAKQELELSVEETLQVMKMIENLEDMDDVQDVYHNVKMTDEVLAALESV